MKETAQAAKNVSKRLFEGQVVSDKMDKTIVVRVARRFKHPVVGKIVTSFKKYKAHDEKGEARVGDVVEIVESKPFSKDKHMLLQRVVKKATS